MTLKEARRRAGISQCQLAALAGVTQSMICKIERYGNRPSPRVAEKIAAALKLTTCDATEAREAFGSRAFHLIACDLPYGVQHASQGGSLEKLLARALPGWRGMLKPGGTVAVSFNAQTLKPARVHELMAEAGLSPAEETADGRFAHWVEQAVTRDLAVARRG